MYCVATTAIFVWSEKKGSFVVYEANSQFCCSGVVAGFYFYRIATGSPKDLSSKSDSVN